MLSWPYKDPDEDLDYQLDWTAWLSTGETITVSTFTVLTGDVALGANSVSGAITTIWISGGTLNTSSVVNNRITTSAGRIAERSVRLRIREK